MGRIFVLLRKKYNPVNPVKKSIYKIKRVLNICKYSVNPIYYR